ncbi:serum amyloid P-component-like [Chiloscyllium punctatum]|uniref:serum amyloid P-component-like n=1 Tax=Chiloscyllium punctatum TaxID=137246 RepID=UPI003B64042C
MLQLFTIVEKVYYITVAVIGIPAIDPRSYNGSLYLFERIGFILLNLSCCSNTFIYGVTQSKFREQFIRAKADEVKALELFMKETDIVLMIKGIKEDEDIGFNELAIMILSQGKCDLSKCTTHYLVAMATADLMAIVTDAILYQLVDYFFQGSFLHLTGACIVIDFLHFKSVIFSAQNTVTTIRKHSNEFSQLTAFTLCLRAASEAKRGYSLFSYATATKDNELLLWHNEDTRLSLYFGSNIFHFALPETDALLRHFCVSWKSSTGFIAFWLKGVQSLQKVSNRSGMVRGGGTFILAQEQDWVEGNADSKQSFVGELTDVHLCDHVLSAKDMKLHSQGCHSAGGNIITWHTVPYESRGNMNMEDNYDCNF